MKNFKILKRDFYSSKTTEELARHLLGKYLIHELENTVLIAKINEVEAYLSQDPAAHTFKGRTERTKAMFEEAGTVYIYLSYGNHWCMNIVGGPEGVGEGILLRSLEPIVGLDFMKRSRGGVDEKIVSNGPGKLTKAMSIDKRYYGHKIWEPPLYIAEAEGEAVLPDLIKSSPRVGISKNKDAMLRFYL